MHFCQWMLVGLATLTLVTPAVGEDAAKTDKLEKITVFGAGELTVPKAFKRVKPRINMIEHEFRAVAEGEEASARVTMMAASGEIDANIRRWQGQFSGGKEEDQKTEKLKLGDWEVHIVDVSGTYPERSGGPFAGGKTVLRENYAMTGGILVHPEGRKYFVKMIGPATIVKANRKAFVTMMKSIAP